MKRKLSFMLALSAVCCGSALAEGGILDGIAKVNDAVNGVVWGAPALVLLAFVGVLMTCLTKVFQVAHRPLVQQDHRRGVL